MLSMSVLDWGLLILVLWDVLKEIRYEIDQKFIKTWWKVLTLTIFHNIMDTLQDRMQSMLAKGLQCKCQGRRRPHCLHGPRALPMSKQALALCGRPKSASKGPTKACLLGCTVIQLLPVFSISLSWWLLSSLSLLAFSSSGKAELK